MSAATFKRAFTPLRNPNYRRYFTGQLVSVSGNWMQMVGEMWLILKLTGSGLAVGATAGLQFMPMLLGAFWGGLLADRVAKRRLLMVTQALLALPALTLWALTLSGAVHPWMVFALVFVRGSINAVDNPSRQSFVAELVGRDLVVGAVSLNSLIVQSARVIGPGLAGLVIGTLGVGTCFLLNALTFVAMLVALRGIDPEQLDAVPPSPRAPGQLRSALRHVAATPELLIPLVVMAVVGTLSYNFQVILPLLARFTFGGTAGTYAALTACMASGAIIGAIATAIRGTVSPRILGIAALGFGIANLAAAIAPTLPAELAVLACAGFASVTFAAGVNSTLQLAAAPAMRGRVMSLYSIVFLGSTPIGAPIAGWLAGVAGPRSALALAGVAALLGAAAITLGFRRRPGVTGPELAPSPGARPSAPSPGRAPSAHWRASPSP